MISGELKEFKYYEKMLPQLAFLAEIATPEKCPEPGRYEMPWGYYCVNKGTTVPVDNNGFESHQKYIDVQCMVIGGEYVEWQNTAKLTEETPYSEEKDLAFWQGKGNLLKMEPGMFYVVFPEDAHKPACHVGEPHEYLKIVAKIPVKSILE